MGLGIGERNPNFLHFVFCEIVRDVIDVRSQKTNIGKVFDECRFGPCPHAVALDINADVVNLGIESRQTQGIIAFAAGEFNDDGMVVAKKFVPMSFHFCRIFDVVRVGKGRIL